MVVQISIGATCESDEAFVRKDENINAKQVR